MTDVMPRGDLIEHEHGARCVCGPARLIARVQGTGQRLGFIYVHHSLDGRELHEL